MMRLIGLALILAVMAGAQVKTPPKKKRYAEAAIIWNGNQLHNLCEHYKTDKLKGSIGPGCFMYIAGATQTLIFSGEDTEVMMSPCPGKGVTQEQIADVVIKWMDDHPEKRDLPAPYIVMKSLSDAFPCN